MCGTSVGHIGCFELFGSDRIRSMLDFKGKKAGVTKLGSAGHILMSTLAAHVGLDPRKDLEWVENPASPARRGSSLKAPIGASSTS